MELPTNVRAEPARQTKKSSNVEVYRYYIEGSEEFWGATCRVCAHNIPYENLVKDTTKKHGRGLICYPCNYGRVLERKVSNREKVLEEKRRYHVKHGKRDEERKLDRRRARSEAELIVIRLKFHPDGVKKCGGCLKVLPLSSFYSNRITADGLDRVCSVCNQNRAERWRLSRAPKKWAELVVPILCVYCGGPYQHADHLIPLHAGGPDTLENLVPACAKCNLSKNKTPLNEWYPKYAKRHDISQTLGELKAKLLSFGYQI